MRRHFLIRLASLAAGFVLTGAATDTITLEYYSVELLPSAGELSRSRQ